MTRPPAKSPRQDAKVIEAWACVNPTGKIYTLGTDHDEVADEIADSPLFRDYRIVRLTSAPPTAADGRVAELEREVKRLRKHIRLALNAPAWDVAHDILGAALTSAKKGRVKP